MKRAKCGFIILNHVITELLLIHGWKLFRRKILSEEKYSYNWTLAFLFSPQKHMTQHTWFKLHIPCECKTGLVLIRFVGSRL
ncbi:hypothetical protein ABVT39_027023 [Epinephelus coioides]